MEATTRSSMRFAACAVLAFALSGCGDDDDGDAVDPSDDAAVSAPASLAGKRYRLDIESGSGALASEGFFTVAFADAGDTYVSTGDGIRVGDAAGTYTYVASGDRGTVVAEDSATGTLRYRLLFTTPASGRFTGTADADPDATQSGTFVER